MLAELTIENLGVIPAATAELDAGLTVLTGETGAGKTMVVTGLRLLAGGRADASRIRAGSERAVVEGRFVTEGMGSAIDERVRRLVEEAGGTADENGDYLASRVVQRKRSRAHLGGRTVPAAGLAEFAGQLLTIHGQNDQLRLLSPEEQLDALDRFSPTAAARAREFRALYSTWYRLAKDLKARTESRRELAQEVDRLRFALGEIDAVEPVPGEDRELVQKVRRLQEAEGQRHQVLSALEAIDGADAVDDAIAADEAEAAAALVGRAADALRGDDERLSSLSKRLDSVANELGDVSSELGRLLADLPVDPGELDRVLDRQRALKALTRKYAPTIDEVLAWRDQARRRLESIDMSPEAIRALAEKVEEKHAAMLAAGERLTDARREAAGGLERAVTEELHGLAMPKARLVIGFDRTRPAPGGLDRVTMMLAANPSAEPQPLAQAASGGELSRVMLALEVILAGSTPGTTLVFDEVDAGVGGRAAVEIGRRLSRLAATNQVIAVTHLPQVAAYADTHLRVAKDVTDESVTAGVERLTGERRVEELARMLAGLDDTDTGRAHAAELLSRARAEASEFRGRR